MIVRPLRAEPDHPALTPGRDYAVVGIEADAFRVIDDQGEPVLYDAVLFEVVDASVPPHWMDTRGADGERYAYPAALHRPGFFEDYFDGQPQAVAVFWQTINSRLSQSAA